MSANRANSATRAPRTTPAPVPGATSAPAPRATPAARATSAPRSAPAPRRPLRLPLAGLLLVLTASAASAGTAGAAHAVGLPRSASGGRLTVRYDDGGGHVRTYRLDCDRRSAEGADRSAGCRRLAEIGGPEPAVAPGEACSMIYGGPQTAEVSGMWNGHPVHERYRRTNGCEVNRWSRMLPALPNPNRG